MYSNIVSSVVYSFIGIAVLFVTFALAEWLTPRHSLRKEILENKNIALAILAGFFMLAIAIIIAAAIHG